MGSFWTEDIPFVAGEPSHWWTLLIFGLFTLGTIRLAAGPYRWLSESIFSLLGLIFLPLVNIGWTIIRIQQGVFDIKTDLPFHLCNLLGLLMPVFVLTKSRRIYEVIYFWIIGGTLQAVITPDLQSGFPSYLFWKYWFVHLGLVYMIVYATFVYGFRPRLRSIFISMLWLEVYLLGMIGLNYLVDANYFYLNQKPPTPTLLDYFGPWPIYILVAQLIIIPYFFMLYAPFGLYRRWKQRRLERIKVGGL